MGTKTILNAFLYEVAELEVKDLKVFEEIFIFSFFDKDIDFRTQIDEVFFDVVTKQT